MGHDDLAKSQSNFGRTKVSFDVVLYVQGLNYIENLAPPHIIYFACLTYRHWTLRNTGGGAAMDIGVQLCRASTRRSSRSDISSSVLAEGLTGDGSDFIGDRSGETGSTRHFFMPSGFLIGTGLREIEGTFCPRLIFNGRIGSGPSGMPGGSLP